MRPAGRSSCGRPQDVQLTVRSPVLAPGPGSGSACFPTRVLPTTEQLQVAQRFAVLPLALTPSETVGVASNIRTALLPLNGLRHRPENGTSGWYLWAGEQFSEDLDFFRPLHHEHLSDWCPAAMPYLALPPGWRFLVAPGYEDVWFDEMLLEID